MSIKNKKSKEYFIFIYLSLNALGLSGFKFLTHPIFLFFWRTSLNIACKADLLVTISSLIISFHSLLTCLVCEACCKLSLILSGYIYFPWLLLRFCLCFWFFSFNIICLGVDYFYICSPCFLHFQGLWFGICDFRKFSVIITSLISSVPLFPSYSGVSTTDLLYLWNCCTVLGCSVPVFCFVLFFMLFFIVFQFEKFLLTYLQSPWYSSQSCPVYWWAQERDSSFVL